MQWYLTTYLQSRYWREKREEILDFFGHKCTECGITFSLCVHHLNYKNLWREEPHKDVTVLCNGHHKEAEGIEHDEFEVELVA